MTEQTQEFEGYDEDAAVSFIRDYVPQNVSDQYSDDEILYAVSYTHLRAHETSV